MIRRGAAAPLLHSVHCAFAHRMVIYGTPALLRKLKKKHTVMANIEKQRRAFAAANKSELESIAIADEPDVCWKCKCGEVHGRLIDVQHEMPSTCSCKMHEACLVEWTSAHEAKGKRVRICPACRCRRKGWQPKSYPEVLCGSVVGDGFCTKPLGHLGNCA